MDKPLVTFRDAPYSLPEPLPPIPVGRTLTPEERALLIQRRDVLCKLLEVYRPDADPDLWTCATYSELMVFAIEALQAERLRIKPTPTPEV